MAAFVQQDQANFIQMKVLEIVQQLSGTTNNFVSEQNILNAAQGFLGLDTARMVLGSLVQCGRMECFNTLGCVADCGGCGCGACATACGCCGRYYRVKIG